MNNIIRISVSEASKLFGVSDKTIRLKDKGFLVVDEITKDLFV